jgi:hypothetical protein
VKSFSTTASPLAFGLLLFSCSNGSDSSDPPDRETTSTGATSGSGAAPGAPPPCAEDDCTASTGGNDQGGGSPDPGGGGSGGTAEAGTGGSATLSGVPDIVVTPPSGTFVETLDATLSASRPGAEIRYTVDGSAPTVDSPLYDGTPLSFSATTQLRARVFQAGAPIGEESVTIYIARDFDVTVDLPIMVLDAYGAPPPEGSDDGQQFPPAGEEQGREYIDAAFMTFETPGAMLSGAPTLVSRAAFHLRGQSTATFEKPPYRLELRDETDADRDLPVFGLPEEADFALRGPFADKALIRDAFFYGLGADMGMVAPRFAHFELYRNAGDGVLNESDYLGVYLLVETIKNSKNRLDLSQLEETDTAPEDLSGGYIFKFEWRAAEEPMIPCPTTAIECWADLEMVDPKPINQEQSTWLGGHLADFVNALYGADFADPASGYQAYIEPDSFVDQIIVNELGREMDSYIRSAYFHKDRDGKIVAGPLWDYNLSLGAGGVFPAMQPDGFDLENLATDAWQYEQERDQMSNTWIQRLLEDPAFVMRLKTRWQELRTTVLSDAALTSRIDALTAPLTEAAERNFARWPNLSDEQIGFFQTPTAPTWQGQVEFVRTWLAARVAWLDTQWS